MKWLIASLWLVLGSLSGLAQLAIQSVPFRTNQNVVLTWDASSTISVSHYLIRRGLSPGVYDQMMRVEGRTNTTLTWTNAPTSVINYFVATAVNPSGLESPPSNEVSIIMERRPIQPTIRTVVLATP